MHKRLIALCMGATWCLSPSVWADEVTLQLPNGLTVLGNLEMAEGKTLKDNGVALFVHGTLAHKDMDIATAQAELLNEREINILRVSLSLGLDKRTGAYDCAAPHTHKHRDAVDEIAAWVDWLNDKGATDITLIGHSRGGNQVAMYATSQPSSLVTKTVLIAPQTWSQDKEVKDYARRYKTELTPVLEEATHLVKAGKGNTLMKEVDFIYCENTQATAAAFADYYTPDDRLHTPYLVHQMTLNTLVIAADNDTVVPDLPKAMVDIDKPNISYSMIEDAGHMFLDFAGEDLADQIAEFIQNTEG